MTAASETRESKPAIPGIAFGLSMMVLSVLIAPLIDLFSKLATETLPTLEITTLRFPLQIACMLPVLAIRGTWPRPTWANTKLHILRGGMLFLSMMSFVAALRYMALADAVAIFFVEPIMLTILSSIFLKEKIGWRRYSACSVGFLGALLVIQPSFRDVGLVALLPVVTAFALAVFSILTRLLSHRQDAFVMQVETCFWGLVFSSIALAVSGLSGETVLVWPDAHGLLWLLGTGLASAVSGLLGVYAYRSAPASTLAPLQYLEIVTATLLGWLVFGQLPDAVKWLGITIIIGSGLYIIWRERRNTKGH
ncbi:DMT family transporter [Rhizobium paknamense]|uniref:S-adenosylmethionine uptake transporter n=1 Tax=Rhizobium paknamense TaxID=1206817 RepID=A0ABU0IBU2_9HYPH|nr:DMT family transporter [Rhizobium paknamense]MDQ0454761.1 S-adenosylmethionine uptake transporter [Rhizobium paknamense]